MEAVVALSQQVDHHLDRLMDRQRLSGRDER
jgi:hypothetical protein